MKVEVSLAVVGVCWRQTGDRRSVGEPALSFDKFIHLHVLTRCIWCLSIGN